MARRKGRKPGGILGDMGAAGGMGGMLQQVQEMQAKMAEAQEAMGDEVLEVSAGGGAITVVITGHQEIREVRIDPGAVDTDDEEWLEDLQFLIVAAINQAIDQSKAMVQERMEEIAGPLAGLMGGGLGDLMDGGLGGLMG
jgi:DNA-binding YbaB/EbfC family protein